MEKSAEDKKGNRMRNVGIVMCIIGFAILIILFITNTANTYPAVTAFSGIVIGISGILLIAEEKIYNADYHTCDFGRFSTKIHDAFVDEWKESTPGEEVKALGCKAKTFKNKCPGGEGVVEIKNYKGTSGRKQHEKVAMTCFFEITYLEFPSEKKRVLNEQRISEIFEEDEGSVRHYSSKNIHIIFQCRVSGFSKYYQKTATFKGAELKGQFTMPKKLTLIAMRSTILK